MTLLWHWGGMSYFIMYKDSKACIIIFISRLFYLLEDTWFKNVTEETFFSTILWIHPTFVGLCVSVVLGENFLKDNRISEFLCFCNLDKFEGLISIRFISSLYGILFFVSLVTHILLFFRVRELEKKKAEGIMVKIYHMDGVTISKRGPDLQTSKKLWKHSRTVVSPKASCISFIFNVLVRSLLLFLLFNIDITLHLMQITALCHNFFFCNLVEVILSPSLSQNFPSYQNRFHVLNV